MTDQFPASSVRNSVPILSVLQRELGSNARIFEIGSGAGYHAMTFASAMPGWIWQPSEIASEAASLQGVLADAKIANLQSVVTLDALIESSFAQDFTADVVYTCNTLHIMSKAAVRNLLQGVRGLLENAGSFVCYGPFKRNGLATTQSNAKFDDWLRAQGGDMGLRDVELIDHLAASAGLQRARLYAMPANNLLGVWEVASS